MPRLHLHCALALAAVLALPLARAADTPSPAPVKASAADRLATARRAIEGKDWNVALRQLQSLERDEPRNADVHNLLGYTLRKKASPDLPQAIAHYKTALQIDPRHRGAHEYIGEAYLMDRKPAEAEKHLAELEKICGKACEEYQDLAKSIAGYKANN
jgi:predicted Zn-dependent protease